MSAHKKAHDIRYFAINDKGEGKLFRHRRRIKEPWIYVRKVRKLKMITRIGIIRDFIKPVVANLPKFTLDIQKTYIVDLDGNKHLYPDDFYTKVNKVVGSGFNIKENKK